MQKSAQDLSPELETQLQNELAILLADLHSPQKILSMLQLFLSATELSVLAKRVAIFKRLSTGIPYESIQKELIVSSATVSTVAQLRKSTFAETVLEHLSAKDWAEQTAHQLRSFFGVKQS